MRARHANHSRNLQITAVHLRSSWLITRAWQCITCERYAIHSNDKSIMANHTCSPVPITQEQQRITCDRYAIHSRNLRITANHKWSICQSHKISSASHVVGMTVTSCPEGSLAIKCDRPSHASCLLLDSARDLPQDHACSNWFTVDHV
jgi:hypothetical protein